MADSGPFRREYQAGFHLKWIFFHRGGSILFDVIFTNDRIGALTPTAGASIIQFAAVTQERFSTDKCGQTRSEAFPLSNNFIQKKRLLADSFSQSLYHTHIDSIF